jgi:hypothetical protein
MVKCSRILGLVLLSALLLLAVAYVFHSSKKDMYIRNISKSLKDTKESAFSELNTEMINNLPEEALSVDTSWYDGLINGRLGYRRSYKKMLDMILAGTEGIPGYTLPSYISAIPMIYVRAFNLNGKFCAYADDKSVTAFLLDEERHILGYIELSDSGRGRVSPASLVRGAGMFEAGTVKENTDEEYIFIQNRNKTFLLHTGDKVYNPHVGADVKIEAGCYDALYSNDLAVSYNEICENAVRIKWQSNETP